MITDDKIFVAGHRGLVGSAILRSLRALDYGSLVVRGHQELDLVNQSAVESFFREERPLYVFLAAARVGGIHANNTYRADFIYQNLMIQANVIHAAYRYGVKGLLFLGSSCIYPRECPQPIREEYLLTGSLEQTNEPYAIAKIVGLKMCESYNIQHGTRFFAVMPTNLYGNNDNFDLNTSHVIPALIRKAHEAKVNKSDSVQAWGSGKPLREFLFVDDLADACVHLMQTEHSYDMINVGSGDEVNIRTLAEIVCAVVGFTGRLEFDDSRPDGTPRKLLDSSRIESLGWRSQVSLREGIQLTYSWYLENLGNPDREHSSNEISSQAY